MKKIYAVLEAEDLGADTTLRALPTACDLNMASSRRYKEMIETFDSNDEAIVRAEALVRENPTKTYHVVESVLVLSTDMPIKAEGFEEAA